MREFRRGYASLREVGTSARVELSTGMVGESQALVLLRGDLQNVLAGSFFLFIGFFALLIAAVRFKKSSRLLICVGLWSGMYGFNHIFQSETVIRVLPPFWESTRGLLVIFCNYFIIVAAAFAFLELTLGMLRRFLQVHLLAGIVVAVGAIIAYLTGRSESTFVSLNEALAPVLLAPLIVTLCVPSLSRRFLVLARHRVLTIGTLIFSAIALWVNMARGLRITVPDIYNTLAFAVFLLSVGYTGLELVLLDERRLLSLDKELAIARQLQFSILPERLPDIANLRMAATYRPMTEVAGDFYEFLPIDQHRIGFLVADVSGHGVPAALIASMIKVAGQSLNGCTSDPAEVLHRLGAILLPHLKGQFVSASYLCLDSESRTACYSAAGHPPLLWWRAAEKCLARIESNGLLFGVLPDTGFPVCHLSFAPGDRILLYTDGLTEPENASGEAFGDYRLEAVIRESPSLSANELSQRLLEALRTWHTSASPQHDDITLIVIDIL